MVVDRRTTEESRHLFDFSYELLAPVLGILLTFERQRKETGGEGIIIVTLNVF